MFLSAVKRSKMFCSGLPNQILLKAPKRLGPALTACVGMNVVQIHEPLSSDFLWPPPTSKMPIPALGLQLSTCFCQCCVSCSQACSLLKIRPAVTHLVSDEVDLVLDLWDPLTDDGEKLWDGGARIQQDLQTRRIIWVKECEDWNGKENANKRITLLMKSV